MIIGTGVDMVSISRIAKAIENPSFISVTFTKGEIKEAETRKNKAEFYAGRFACKEAIFKALHPDFVMDWRTIETLHHSDGQPYVNPDSVREVMKKADVSALHISISNENDTVIAFCVAEKR